MSDTPTGDHDGRDDLIVGISFEDSFRAQEFLTASYRMVAKHQVELRDAVMIAKDADGRATVRETVDPQPGRSALSGGMWAGLFGLLLGGPVGWVAGAAIGAGAGAVTAKVIDIGIPDEWVDWFRDAVQPSTVTVVLLIGRYERHTVIEELERFAGGRLVYANVGADTIHRIRQALGDDAQGPLTRSDVPEDGGQDGGGPAPLPPPEPGSAVTSNGSADNPSSDTGARTERERS